MTKHKKLPVEVAVNRIASRDDALDLLRNGITIITKIGALQVLVTGQTLTMGNIDTDTRLELAMDSAENAAAALLLFGDPDKGEWYVHVPSGMNGVKPA